MDKRYQTRTEAAIVPPEDKAVRDCSELAGSMSGPAGRAEVGMGVGCTGAEGIEEDAEM